MMMMTIHPPFMVDYTATSCIQINQLCHIHVSQFDYHEQRSRTGEDADRLATTSQSTSSWSAAA